MGNNTNLYIGGTKGVSRCNKARAYGIEVSDITKETFKRTAVTREAIKLYKYDTSVTMQDVDDFIEEKFQQLSFPNDTVRELNKAEVVALVHRYLEFDDRKAYPCATVDFEFAGQKLSYKPMFVYYSEEEVLMDRTRRNLERVAPKTVKVPVVEVVTMTTGKQKYTNGNNYGAGKETVSLHHNLDGLGLLMAGMSLLKGKAGIVRCCTDALKTNNDTASDYTAPFEIAKTDNKGTKSSCNRNWFEVFFNEKGQIVPTYKALKEESKRRISRGSYSYYPLRSYKVTRVTYDNSKLFPQYKETLENFLKGKDGCSQSACKDECPYYELCYYNHQPVAKDEEIVEKREAKEPSLNSEQEKVVAFRDGICCVDAGPGSGKTQCMAYRIAKLLCEGAKPSEILVVSFSKSAVKVITDRVKFFVHDVYGLTHIDTSKIKIGTFNSLGNELIAKYHKELGYTEVPEMVDEVEMFNHILSAIDFNNPCEGFDYKNYSMKSLNRNNKGGVVAEVTSQVAFIREHDIKKEGYLEHAKNEGYTEEQAEYIWSINEKYTDILIANNLIDYSDQCYQVLRLIDTINEDAIVDTYCYKHIIVDEFQDSNDFQMVFIGELMNTSTFRSLMVVGDDAQAIYAFRGTTPDNIINFEEKINSRIPVTEFTLGRNYRSTEEIVELGNEILSHNSTKIQKVLTSNMGTSGNKPKFKSFEKVDAEIKFICDNIEKLIADGVEKNQIAVIASKKTALKRVSKELSKRGILSQYDMGERLLDNSRVRAGIGFCNFATDTDGTKGLLEYLNEVYNNTLFDKFSSSRVKALLDTAKEDFLNNYVPLSMDNKKDYIIKALELLDDGTDAIYSSFLEKVKAKSRYNVFEILKYVRQFYELDINATAEKKGTYDAVAIVTAHSSKGKEWEHTFVSLSNFDDVPCRSLEEKEEKRRLIFVACTRAKYGLTVTTLRNKDKEGDYTPINPWYAEMKNYSSFENLDMCH